jgi:hypothetical protein
LADCTDAAASNAVLRAMESIDGYAAGLLNEFPSSVYRTGRIFGSAICSLSNCGSGFFLSIISVTRSYSCVTVCTILFYFFTDVHWLSIIMSEDGAKKGFVACI